MSISLILVGLFILLSSTLTFRKIYRDMSFQSQQVLMNRVMLIQLSISSTIDEAKARLQTMMVFLEQQEMYEEIDRANIDAIRDSIISCRHLWILGSDQSLLMDSGTSLEYLDNSSWWKPYLEDIILSEPPKYEA